MSDSRAVGQIKPAALCSSANVKITLKQTTVSITNNNFFTSHSFSVGLELGLDCFHYLLVILNPNTEIKYCSFKKCLMDCIACECTKSKINILNKTNGREFVVNNTNIIFHT